MGISYSKSVDVTMTVHSHMPSDLGHDTISYRIKGNSSAKKEICKGFQNIGHYHIVIIVSNAVGLKYPCALLLSKIRSSIAGICHPCGPYSSLMQSSAYSSAATLHAGCPSHLVQAQVNLI